MIDSPFPDNIAIPIFTIRNKVPLDTIVRDHFNHLFFVSFQENIHHCKFLIRVLVIQLFPGQ